MKNLFIPPLGTEIELAKKWKFPLYGEYRNSSLFDHLKLKMPQSVNWEPKSIEATLPVGTILKIDRIYIRKGQNDFNSVTFNIVSINGQKVKRVRFWVKLDDANIIKIKD